MGGKARGGGMSALLRILETAQNNEVIEFLSCYGGRRVRIPTLSAFLRSERDKAIRLHWREGMGYAALKARHGLSERQIRRILEHDWAA